MLQYNVEFFDRNLDFVYNCTIDGVPIEDDYISLKVTRIDIPSTQQVLNGHFIRLQNERVSFLGVVSDVSPGEYITKVSFKPFISLFDEDFVFDTTTQGTSNTNHLSLEETILYYLGELYANSDDVYQRLPISVEIDSYISLTTRWSLNITPETEGSHYRIMNLYSSLLVGALKKYGVVIDAIPSFAEKNIRLVITKRVNQIKIDADLNDITVETIKYNERQTGVNKLEVYNTEDYTQYITFYVHSDRSWDAIDADRITPVAREVRSVAPSYAAGVNANDAFADAAYDIAYSVMSGLTWDNLIELVVYYSDPNVEPLSLGIGQTAVIMYKDGRYTSILTGRIFSDETMTLLFGSERIEYSKRLKQKGGT